MNNNKFVTVRLYPVCECGYVLRDLKIERIISRNSLFATAKDIICPNICPNCNRVISTVQVPDIKDRIEEVDL